MDVRRSGGWPWYPFVVFAIGMALLPGLSLGVVLGSVITAGVGPGPWYASGVQAHGHALLLGWGGGMVLGIALHFLPRLRRTSLAHPRAVPWLFWAFAAGTVLRFAGQLVWALAGAAGPLWVSHWGRAGAVAGVALQAAGALGLLGVLVRTLRSGPPLGRKQPFVQVAPLLLLAAMELAGGLCDLFPDAGCQLGIVAHLLQGLGLLTGTWAARVLHARRVFPSEPSPYRTLQDPAAVGVVSAYIWAALAGLFLLLRALDGMGLRLTPGPAVRDLGLHAAGVGFMTLLIVGTGWTMLPGFRQQRPRGRPLIWGAVMLGNTATLLRVLPGVAVVLAGSAAPGLAGWALPGAGVAAIGAILCFAGALAASLRRGPAGLRQ